jgi:hypothetical protein
MSREVNRNHIVVDQCLYGYDDGHRLLAGSRKLSAEPASQLLLYSDLAAGTAIGPEGYWTGVPLPGARSYALMRTWPAPEMPRPGCVWTHVLLIAFEDLDHLRALTSLTRHFLRPDRNYSIQSYASPLMLEDDDAIAPSMETTSRSSVLRILRAVYRPELEGVAVLDNATSDLAVLSVWSQQWPRLRRTFSFRTAASQTPAANMRFDLRIVRRPERPERPDDLSISEGEPWEQVALDDIFAERSGGFRIFLWRYGIDLRKDRSGFPVLGNIYSATRVPILKGEGLHRLLDDVAVAFPDKEDASTLKLDLLDGAHEGTRLPVSDQSDVLDYLLLSPRRGAFPLLLPTLIDRLFNNGTLDAKRVLSSAELALLENPDGANVLLTRLAQVLTPHDALSLTGDHLDIRGRLIQSNPALLDCDDLPQLPEAELVAAVQHLPADSDIFDRVASRLLSINTDTVATLLVRKSAHKVAILVFNAIAQQLAGVGANIGQAWLTQVQSTLREMLPLAIVDTADSTSKLAACAILLELDVSAGLAANPVSWAKALASSRDDIFGQSKQRLLAYLLTLALAQPVQGCELLIERSFETVHKDIADSQLPYDAFDVLARYLPNLFWWEQWDTCLRLRMAVVTAYLSGRLSPNSFNRLTKDEGLRRSLIQIATRSREGRQFLESASQ